MINRKLVLCIWVALIRPSYQISEEFHEDSVEFGVPTLLLDSLHLTLSSKLLLDIYSPKGHGLKGYLGWLPQQSNSSYTSCSGDNSLAGTICLKYDKGMELMVTQDNGDQCEEDTMTCHSVACYKIHWKNHINGAMDCFVLGEDFWYGGGETISQRWPLQSDSRTWYPTATGDPLHHSSGNVQENIWLSSGGFSIYVEHHVPLFVSFNVSGSGSDKLCLSTSSKTHPFLNLRGHTQELAYSICTATSVKEAFRYTAHRWLKKPSKIPEEDVFEYPIWSTWARHKQEINESSVLDFALKIKQSGMPISQLEIDDKWEKCYGDLEFDLHKFPNPQRLTTDIERLGFPTTLWVHPFCNLGCKCYNIGKENGFWVKDKKGNPVDIKWWNGVNSALLDTTNKKATEWFTERLKRLQTIYGIESFKFDAGELQWIESDFIFDEEASLQPNIYSREYARLAAQFGGRVEVRVGYESQELPVFIRMFDRFSHWDYSNGLQTLIPTALQLSMQGYYFILPDMVGGNNYTPNDGSLPDRELYIRWLQANVFLPVLQFSIAPFDYDDEVLRITKKMLELREKYTSYILNLAVQATQTGHPIIRPLWWVAPDDDEALSTDSQFLLGDGIMVAPVLKKGAKQRNIYLPEGKWADVQRGKTYEGSQWLYEYKAPLNFLPFFVRHS